MAKCWTCGAHIERPLFTCPACSTVEEIQGLRRETASNLDSLAEIQRRGFEELSNTLSEGLSGIASVIEWGFEEISWQLQQQTAVLQSIDHTLKTPTQTQANEWRQMAEELRSREVLDKSEEFFLKSLETNPLDYRTYIGLTEAYLKTDRFDEAKAYLEKSLPHAPRLSRYRQEQEIKRRQMRKAAGLPPHESEAPSIFDYRSYSYRLIGHIYACREKYPDAVSVLRSAVELSPNYYEAIYDLAQYSAQVRDKETCLSSLRSLIDADSFYFYLAQKGKDFEPLSLEIGNWLKEINANASNEAKREIAKAEESVNEAEEALRKYSNKERLLASSIGLLESAKSELSSAKSKVALENYRASLDAIHAAKAACRLANRAKEEAGEKLQYYKNERTKILKELLWYAPLVVIGFGILGSIGGCVLWPFTFADIDKLRLSGFILGTIGGAIYVLARTSRNLDDIGKTKP